MSVLFLSAPHLIVPMRKPCIAAFVLHPSATPSWTSGCHPCARVYVSAGQLNHMEPFYPLHVYVCEKCFLVQMLEYVTPDHIFTEYAYFSSYSNSWLRHAQNYVEMISNRLVLGSSSLVVELASNDGYLLQYFVATGIPVLGIEPAKNVAHAAVQKGIPTVTEFFGERLARQLTQEGRQADLLLGNNVLAHVPDINDFVGGMKILLKPEGVITMEFPHLLRLMEHNQYDTIYHEHFSYLSLTTTESIFAAHGLRLFDVEELATHGGSLRIYACHAENTRAPTSARVLELKACEAAEGFGSIEHYIRFSEKVVVAKRNLLDFLIRVRRQGKRVAGYGAPGKGNTLLNYCGIRTDFLDYTVDRNPYKQGKFLPGTHIPIFPPEKLQQTKPDFILVLPWNLREEVSRQLGIYPAVGGKACGPNSRRRSHRLSCRPWKREEAPPIHEGCCQYHCSRTFSPSGVPGSYLRSMLLGLCRHLPLVTSSLLISERQLTVTSRKAKTPRLPGIGSVDSEITMIHCELPRLKRILCLGAHSDDIEIGCGGTILKLLQEQLDLEVFWVVFSATGHRAQEARASARAFLKKSARSRLIVKAFKERFFPFHGEIIKEFFDELKMSVKPDLVFTHYRDDRHQDHRTISDLTWNTFRDHFILEYEIPKYDGDLGVPNTYSALSVGLCRQKVRLLLRHFRTQMDKRWFTEELFYALLKIRGVECGMRYAEAFHCRKILL